ncbi:MAG: hypothetical protein Q4B09_10095 [Lachnospiraceae bacterium]|nr:hypothetical protein [Lachnospiraceae bacterium]
MNMDFEALRKDLIQYFDVARQIGLLCAAESEVQIMNADEAELVSLAADQGWDLGRYIQE